MKQDFFSKNKWFFVLAFFIILIVTFSPLFTTGFATADDFLTYLGTRRGIVMDGFARAAKFSGRFHLFIVGPFYFLPYIVDNVVVIKLFQIVPVVVCFILFATILRRVIKSVTIGWIYVLIFLCTMQISKHTNLFVAYPLYFTISFSLLLTSVYLLIRFFENRNKLTLVASALIFGAGLLFYETYIFFEFFALIIILSYTFKDKIGFFEKIKNSAACIIPFLTVGILYLIAYFIFRVYYPSQYDGSNLAAKGTSISSFFLVLWKLAYSSIPLTIYETSRTIFQERSELIGGYSSNLLRIMLNAHVEWIAKGILVAFCGYYLLMKAPKIRIPALLKYSAMAILLVFVPHIPLALTEKYIFYVGQSGMIGYVTTFFSFFGVVLFVSVLLSFMVNLLNFNRMMKRFGVMILLFLLFICSVVTDFSNYTIAKDIRSANLRFFAIDEFCKTDEFKSLPREAPCYGKSLWDNPSSSAASLTEQGFDWQEYFSVRGRNGLPVCRDEKSLLDYAREHSIAPCYLVLRQAEKSEDVLLAFAKLPPVTKADSVVNPAANRAFVVYYSSYTCFTVTFHVGKNLLPGTMIPIKIKHIADEVPAGETVQVIIFNTKKGGKSTCFSIEYPGIDLNSIIVSNMVNRGNKYFYL